MRVSDESSLDCSSSKREREKKTTNKKKKKKEKFFPCCRFFSYSFVLNTWVGRRRGKKRKQEMNVTPL